MLILQIDVPYASFRKSYARSFAETYPLPPPATIYGMLLSLVGERFRQRHEGVRLAFAYKQMPKVATTLRKLSRFKYGVATKQSKLGNAPDYIETLCDIEFLCWVDSTQEKSANFQNSYNTLELRILEAIENPQNIDRYGVLSLGLSDDAVNDISLYQPNSKAWHRLVLDTMGNLELPIWVDHVGAANTRWQRYYFEANTININNPYDNPWTDNQWTIMNAPC